MEWLIAVGVGVIGYAAAAIAGGLALTIERQPEASATLFGAVRLLGLGIALLGLVFGSVMIGYGVRALV